MEIYLKGSKHLPNEELETHHKYVSLCTGGAFRMTEEDGEITLFAAFLHS